MPISKPPPLTRGRMKDLESLASHVRDAFVDVEKVVAEHGDIIDNAERETERALAEVDAARHDTYMAVRYKIRAQQKRCMVLVCFIVFVFIGASCLWGALGVHLLPTDPFANVTARS